MHDLRTRSIYILLLLFTLIPFKSKAQQNSSENRFTQWFLHDPVSFTQDFDRNSFAQIGLYSLAIAGISSIDESSSKYFKRHFSESNFINFSNDFGEINYAAPVSALIFGSSLLTDNTKFQDAAFTSFQSIFYTAVTVNISKFIFARSRPYDDNGAFDFDFLEFEGTSFPSGHSSTAFALLTPWVMYYPNLLTYSLILIPTGTSIARIAKGEHWATDVVAGALIGSYWGMYLSKSHKDKTPDNVIVTPFVTVNSGGVTVSINL